MSQRTGVIAFYLVVSIVFCWPLFAQPLALGVNDWDQHLFYYGVVLKNVVEYGQMPFWNPWYCAGNVMWQNPQIAILSPVYPLAMLMPLQLAMKLNIVLHYWIGFAGVHLLLARGIGLTSTPITVLLATIATAAGATAIHLTAGHSVFLPGFYLPLLTYSVLRAIDEGRSRLVFAAGALLALMVFNGGAHILPMVVAAIGSYTLFASVLSRSWRPLIVAAAFFAAGFSLAAPKLLPVALYVTGDTFWDTRNATEHPDRMTVEMLRHAYLDPDQNTGLSFALQRHKWQEYGNYIGPLAVLIIGLGIAGSLATRDRPGSPSPRALALTAIVLFTLSLGEFSPLAPASLAHSLPLFSSFRIPSRYAIPFTLFGVLAAAAAAQAVLGRRQLSRPVVWTIAVICAVGSLQLLVLNRHFFNRVFRDAPAFDTTFHFMSGPAELAVDRDSNPYRPGSPMLRALMADQSFFSCYESLQVKRTADSGHPLVYGENGTAVTGVKFSPNRIEFDATGGSAPARIFLNQNFAYGWTSSAGTVERETGTDRLSVTLAPGQSGHYAFVFTPPGFWMGLLVATVAAIAAVWLSRKHSPPWAARGNRSLVGVAATRLLGLARFALS
jgi:hypothetical protein